MSHLSSFRATQLMLPFIFSALCSVVCSKQQVNEQMPLHERLLQQAHIAESKGQLELAIAKHLEAMDSLESENDYIRMAVTENSLYERKTLYEQIGEFAESQACRKKLRDMLVQRVGANNNDVSAFNLEIEAVDEFLKMSQVDRKQLAKAIDLCQRGRWAGARKYYGQYYRKTSQAKEIFESLLPPDHLYAIRGRALYLDAKRLVHRLDCLDKECFDLIDKFTEVLGHDHSETIQLYRYLAAIFKNAGEFEKALEQTKIRHELLRKKLGPGHRTVVGAFYQVQRALAILGREHEVGALLNDNLAYYNDENDPEMQHRTYLLTHLANHYQSINYSTSVAYAEKALEMLYDKTPLPTTDYQNEADCHQILGTNEERLGNFDAAIEHYEHAEKLYNTLNQNYGFNIDLTPFRVRYGHLLMSAWRKEKSLEILELAVKGDTQDRNYPKVMFAYALLNMRQYRKALGYVDDVIKSSKVKKKIESVQFIKCLMLKSLILQSLDRNEEALNTTREAFEVSEQQLRHALPFLDDLWAIQRVSNIHVLFMQANDLMTGELDEELFEMLLRTRGLVSRNLATRNRMLNELESSEQESISKRVMNVRRKLAQEILFSSAPEQTAIASIPVAQLRLEQRKLISELQPLLNIPNDLEHENRVAKLEEAIPPGWSTVTFYFAYEIRDVGSVETYHAMVSSKDKDGNFTVAKVDLGAASSINKTVRQLAECFGPQDRGIEPVTSEIERARQQAIRKSQLLREKVWDKLLPDFKGNKNIIICADQELNRVPWNALYDANKQPLLKNFSICSLDYVDQHPAWPKTQKPSNRFQSKNMILIGGLEYGNHELPKSDSPLSVKWNDLPKTLEEVQLIANLWKKNSGQSPTVTSGSNVSEQDIVKSLSQANYLHLAGHGFSLPRVENEGLKRNFGNGIETSQQLMASTGIVTCAPSNAQRSKDPTLDGYLTGEEIMDLDLSHLELVVLSACDTGSGQIIAMEGVFGIDRAFRVAGAKSTLSSLYPVPDEATRKLTEYFYTNLFNQGLSKREALRQAQLKMIQDGEPMAHWASWVLYGDWN